MSVTHKITPIQLAILCCSLLVSSPAFSHFFINVGGANVSIDDGSMDGVSGLRDSNNGVAILPKHDNAIGLNIGIGTYWDKGSFNLNIVSSEHDGLWRGIKTSSEFRSMAFDLKMAVIGQNDLKGQVIFGIGTTSLIVKNGAVDSASNVGDVKYKGFDFRLGAGVRYRVTDNVSLEFNVIRRIGSYESADGVASGTLITHVDGDGFTTSLDLIYVFGK